MNFFLLLKKGNTSSGVAALGNAGLAIIKGLAAAFSGNGTMFASAMHSLADAVNQGFVFLGSALSEMKPSKRFPLGFGRVVNIFCMVAVIVVTIMAYETVKEGWHLLRYPTESSNFFLNIAVLAVSFLVDGFILLKAMKEILKETQAEKSKNIFISAFKHAGKASPATRLVFYEDLVATSGALLAIVGIILAQLFGILQADGAISILIGFLMFFVAFRVGYDNMIGLIGVAAPADVEKKVADIILNDKDVVDINQLRVIQEGRLFHIDSIVELTKGLTLADADDIKFRVEDQLLRDADVADVVIGIIEDDGIIRWKS
ncbi:cation diffusion facilitator family transporter [Lederbergia lenta]|uniref:Cation diffusion facilitator family transporter n=1 Tax=Lederbergia lenta TaxID=1467 RepID=A0A2X4W6B0_LEDLE|nr:cation diffusion facilitator family transporter [Lederbergia lenta]MCM3109494.1 cation diffusion facilitator family transporter [Lederbergia lenta]MEC2324752.1 cation diffusion facilitator family transporter [Lederbergia lenta]SQI58239.1 cation diffusion facilitator family transporter [Lederbergia lenta]